MMEDNPRSSLLHGRQQQQNEEAGPLYYDSSQTPNQRYIQLAFVTAVIVSVAISLIISIYRGAVVTGLYFMLGMNLVGFVVIEICMILFVRNGDLPSEKAWFLYFVGGCVILESIFMDIMLMDD